MRPPIPFTNKELPKVMPAGLGKVLLPYLLYEDYKKTNNLYSTLKKKVPLMASIVGGVRGALGGVTLAQKALGHYDINIPSPISSMPRAGTIGALLLGGLLGGAVGSLGSHAVSSYIMNKYFPESKVKEKDEIIFI